MATWTLTKGDEPILTIEAPATSWHGTACVSVRVHDGAKRSIGISQMALNDGDLLYEFCVDLEYADAGRLALAEVTP